MGIVKKTLGMAQRTVLRASINVQKKDRECFFTESYTFISCWLFLYSTEIIGVKTIERKIKETSTKIVI